MVLGCALRPGWLVALAITFLAISGRAWADETGPATPVPPGDPVNTATSEAPTLTTDGFPVQPVRPWSRLIFIGVRSDLGFPLGGSASTPNRSAVVPTLSLEMGYAPRFQGVGWGIRATISTDAPALFGAFPAESAEFGVLGELRYYFQVAGPVQLYPALAFGWLVGASSTSSTIVPVLNTGFGLRTRLGRSAYIAVELGLATFVMPYVALSFGVCGEVE